VKIMKKLMLLVLVGFAFIINVIPAAAQGSCIISGNNVNIRGLPLAEGIKLSALNGSAEGLAYTSGFYGIHYSGGYGWVSETVISTSGNCNNLPGAMNVTSLSSETAPYTQTIMLQGREVILRSDWAISPMFVQELWETLQGNQIPMFDLHPYGNVVIRITADSETIMEDVIAALYQFNAAEAADMAARGRTNAHLISSLRVMSAAIQQNGKFVVFTTNDVTSGLYIGISNGGNTDIENAWIAELAGQLVSDAYVDEVKIKLLASLFNSPAEFMDYQGVDQVSVADVIILQNLLVRWSYLEEIPMPPTPELPTSEVTPQSTPHGAGPSDGGAKTPPTSTPDPKRNPGGSGELSL
jgi:hypothetical protein